MATPAVKVPVLTEDTEFLMEVDTRAAALNVHEKRYGQIDKEALAIIFGLKRFHLYLYGRHFTILTDHKPLERIFGPKTAIPSLAAMRLQRWAIILSALDYSIRFVPSKHNAVADALSRLPSKESIQSEEY